jgi:CRP-like cAMP-binding protein
MAAVKFPIFSPVHFQVNFPRTSRVKPVSDISRQMLTRAAVPPKYPVHASAIESMGTSASFVRNRQIYRDTEPARYVYKLISGTVRTCRVLSDGRRQIAAFYMPGDFFGLERAEKRLFTAEAIIDAKLTVINLAAVISRAKKDNDIARQLWTLMECELQLAQTHSGLLIKTRRSD